MSLLGSLLIYDGVNTASRLEPPEWNARKLPTSRRRFWTCLTDMFTVTSVPPRIPGWGQAVRNRWRNTTALWEAWRTNYAWAQQVAKDDSRITAERVTVPSPQGNGEIRGYLVRPAKAAGKLPAVLVVHENRG